MGFGHPRQAKKFLDTFGNIKAASDDMPVSQHSPRLILKPLVRRAVYSFTETGERRPLSAGEWGWDGAMINHGSVLFDKHKHYHVYKMLKYYVWE